VKIAFAEWKINKRDRKNQYRVLENGFLRC